MLGRITVILSRTIIVYGRTRSKLSLTKDRPFRSVRNILKKEINYLPGIQLEILQLYMSYFSVGMN
mgnify:CR=1 FL=1